MLRKLHFRKENVTIHVPDGANLRAVCLESGIDPYPVLGGMLSCRGHGFCGTCLVGVEPDEALAPPGPREARFLRKRADAGKGVRLSCQALIAGDLTVTTDPDPEPAWRSHPYYSGRVPRSWESAS